VRVLLDEALDGVAALAIGREGARRIAERGQDLAAADQPERKLPVVLRRPGEREQPIERAGALIRRTREQRGAAQAEPSIHVVGIERRGLAKPLHPLGHVVDDRAGGDVARRPRLSLQRLLLILSGALVDLPPYSFGDASVPLLRLVDRALERGI